MPFRALFDGKPVWGLTCQDAEWQALVQQVRSDPSRLTLQCCGVTAIPCISPRQNFYFRHRRQPPTCDWKPESPEHVDLKARVAASIVSVGWTAEVEAVGSDWKADVLATRGKARIAFEVQLSAQGQSETELREERYFSSNVLPWWIVNNRNDGDGFGSDRRTALVGDSVEERIASVAPNIVKFLKRVERHVEIAAAVKAALVKRNLQPFVEGLGAIPSVFRIKIGEGTQPIVIGEIGVGAIRDMAGLQDEGGEAPWGATVQFVRASKQIRGFGATAFYLKGRDIGREVDDTIERLVSGKAIWIGRDDKENIEASYVWYDDACPGCRKNFVRVPYFIYAHRKFWPNRSPSASASHTIEQESYDRTLDRLAKRLGRPIGKIVKKTLRYEEAPPTEAPLVQSCPHCGATSSDSLISAQDAISWPLPEIDFSVSTRVMDNGWLELKQPTQRPLPAVETWESLLAQAREDRAKELAERERVRLEREAASKAAMEAWQKERERRKAEAAAEEERKARELEERRRLAEEERLARIADERAIRLAEAQERLLSLALRKCQDREKVDLWLRNYDPKLRGRPMEVCGEFFNACQKRLEEIRF